MTTKNKLKRKLSTNSEENNSNEDLSDDLSFLDESESESEHECDNWDFDCKISKTKSKGLQGYHLMPTCIRNPEETNKKQRLLVELRDELLSDDFCSNFKSKWNDNDKLIEKGVELIVNPFKVCVIEHFLKNAQILNDIRQELNDLNWNTRTMDLYEFFQTDDLKYISNHLIRLMYDFLQNNVMKWVAQLIGVNLTHMSATCSLYTNTDYLLLHDDQRSDRMVAFVMYINGTNGWNVDKGGALQLWDKDEMGQPLKVTGNILPNHNQFVFFPVTNYSYHQVAEVTSLEDCRFSINGWFHTKTIPIYHTIPFKPLSEGLFSSVWIKAKEIDIDLETWLNEDYLNCDITNQIQEYFEENSEICLKNFLKIECFSGISEILFNGDLKWTKVGPPNRFNYEIVKTKDLPHILDRLFGLFQSKQMYKLLHRFTDLDLKCMKCELQKWTNSSYSLLNDDYNWKKKELDLIIHFGCKDNSDVIGCRTQYVTIEDEIQNALITLDPEENNLNIIYRDTAKFTKYFSKQSKCLSFYTLVCSYSE